ncbi:MAG: hypothetical protein ABIJ09_27550 [Pseudomonadota bacterium]
MSTTISSSTSKPVTPLPQPKAPTSATSTPPTAATAADRYIEGGHVNQATASNLAAGSSSNGTPSGEIRKPVAKGLDNASAAAPVDFSKMSQDQQYDYLQKLTVQRAGGDASAWKSGDREVNLVGIRSFNGTPQGQKVDRYDDMIYAARIVDGKKTVEAFPASVDAGIQSNDANTPYRLDDGFYRNAWTRGEVVGGEQGLRQNRDLEVWKDSNNNGVLEDSELKAGKQMLSVDAQLQFHRGDDGRVGDASRGCQVIDPDRYDRFQQILKEAPASQRDFSYMLTDSCTLPGIRPDGSSQNTVADRGHCGSRGDPGKGGGGIGIIRTPQPSSWRTWLNAK